MNGKKISAPRKLPIAFDPKRSWPRKDGYYYECMICQDTISGMVPTYVRCRCRNLSIDPEAGRMGAREESKIRLFEKRSP